MPLVVRRSGDLRGQGRVLRLLEDGVVLPAAGQIPMRREGGSASERALATAREVLNGGGILGIYPKGRVLPTGGSTAAARGGPAKPGLPGHRDPRRSCRNHRRPTEGIHPHAPVRGSRSASVHPSTSPVSPGDSGTDPLTLRAVTDELMFEIRRLSGQVYVDRYAKRHGVVVAATSPTSTPGRRPRPDRRSPSPSPARLASKSEAVA